MPDHPAQPPPVQYARTTDGVSIAYAVGGDGPRVALLPFHISHVKHRWSEAPSIGGWAPALAEFARVVTYDSRGQGLSTRNPQPDTTIQSYRLDLEAVLGGVGFQHCILAAYGGFAHVALRFALDHADRVDALVLICTSESLSAWPLGSMVALAEENWGLFVDLMIAGTPEVAKESAHRFVNSTVEPADWVRMVHAFAASNVVELLPQVKVPTLVLHSLDQHWLNANEGTKFAAAVPGARLVFLDGGVEPDAIQGARAIREFLAEIGLGPPPSTTPDALAQIEKRLTERQGQVLALLASGKTNREIAAELVLSERTVERHLADVFGKLGVRNRSEAVALALRRT